MVSTGQGDFRTTFSVVLPNSTWLRPPNPWVDMIIISTFSFLPVSIISLAGEPCVSIVFLLMLSGISSSASLSKDCFTNSSCSLDKFGGGAAHAKSEGVIVG